MCDRPDLVQSELAGLSFDSTQELFRASHLDNMFSMVGPSPPINADIMVFVDPAAGGPSSDYGILSVNRHQGVIMVSGATCQPAPHVPHQCTKTGQCVGATGPPPFPESTNTAHGTGIVARGEGGSPL